MGIAPVEWIFVLLVLLATVVWIWALVDCILHEPAQGTTKLIWVIVIVFTHIVGAVLYLLLRRPRRMAVTPR
jgi:hypothetical protein